MTNKTVLETGAEKDLTGKLRFDLIPPEVLESYAAVLTLGAKKYADRNWEKGIPASVCIGSLMRHLSEFLQGKLINTNDGDLMHVEHMLFWVAALVTNLKRERLDLLDLPAYTEGNTQEKVK